MGLLERIRGKKEDDLGGTPVSPDDDPKDSWGISRKLNEQRVNGNFLLQNPNEIIGEDPDGHDGSVPGLIFIKKRCKKVPSAFKKTLDEHGKEAVIFTLGTAAILGGTFFLIKSKDKLPLIGKKSKNPNP